MIMKDSDKVKKAMKRTQKRELQALDFLSSGSTLLNLACSGRYSGCFIKGEYYYFVGDSTSGKTFLCLTCLAEAALRPDFDNYDFVYDGTTENGAVGLDIKRFFGSKVAKRMTVDNSTTIDEMYYKLDSRLNTGKPFIQIVDSMDGLDSEQDVNKFKEQKKAYMKGREAAGSYGDGKAKINSQHLRKMLTRLRQSGSILIIIGQTRDAIGAMGWGEKKTRAGGRSLKFYAQLELWSSVKGHITKVVNGKPRELGIISKIAVKKNRLTGRDRVAEVPIYHSYGIDDIGSCVDYLINEEHWKGTKSKVKSPEFDFDGLKSKLISQIEANGEERDIRALVKECWNAIEKECEIKRKTRYA
jgi:RecA/RadA recombinase